MKQTKEMKSLQKKYNKMAYQYDPWKQQIVIETINGECVIELQTSDREFHLIKVEQHDSQDIIGLDAINEKVSSMIANGEVKDLYIDSL